MLCFVAALRRYDAAGWLRKMVGVVTARDLSDQPSEEDFRLGLRSGIILCNALNKIQPGAVPKVGLYIFFIHAHFPTCFMIGFCNLFYFSTCCTIGCCNLILFGLPLGS